MTPEERTQLLATLYMDGRTGRPATLGDVQIEQRLDNRLSLSAGTWALEEARAAVAYLQGWITAQELIAAAREEKP